MKIDRKNSKFIENWQENLKFDDNLLKFVEICWNLMHCYQKSLEIRWNLLKIDRKIRDLMKICWKLTGKWKKWMKICWNLWKFWMRNWRLWWCGVEDLLKRSWCKLRRFRIKLGADHLQHSITVRGSLFFVQQDRQWCRDSSLSPFSCPIRIVIFWFVVKWSEIAFADVGRTRIAGPQDSSGCLHGPKSFVGFLKDF